MYPMTLTFNTLTLLIILVGTALIGKVSLHLATTQWQKILLLGVITGLLIYSGVGAAYPEVPEYYLFFYFGFLVAFVIAFKFFSILLLAAGRRVGRKLPKALDSVDRSPIWPWIIFFYVLLHVIPLVYPEFRLNRLLEPPAPDILTQFANRLEKQEVNSFIKLSGYIRLLLGPFFFIALYRYRNRFSIIILLLLILMYLQYIDISYIGRGVIVMNSALIGIVLWVLYPRWHVKLILIGVALLPIMLITSYVYAEVRLGRNVGAFTMTQAIEAMIYNETSFPVLSGVPLIRTGAQVDLGGYFIWIATLPIPKIITGEIATVQVNYEISELVLGRTRESHGFFVILPGLVSESVYIFGKYFFWLHGVMIALISALVVRLTERTHHFLILNAYIVLLFSYRMNRAGISSFLPELLNSFLFFYVFIIISLFRYSRLEHNIR